MKKIILGLLLTSQMAACGQKGNLFLPPPPAPVSSAPSLPATL